MLGRSPNRSRETVITRADRALAAGQPDLALKLYRQALDRNPRNPPIWVQCGHALKEMGRLQEAEAAYRRALSYAPHAAEPYLQLGHALKLQGRGEEAQSAYFRAYALDVSSADAARELAGFGWDEDRLSQFKKTEGVPIAISAPVADVKLSAGAFGRKRASIITLADGARDAGEWESAARLYGRALERNPRNPPIWVQYGHSLKESGALAEAEAAYRTAIGYLPDAAEPWLQLGHLLKLRGRNDEAEAAYLRALALEPSRTDPLDELRALGWSGDQIAELSALVLPGTEAGATSRPPTGAPPTGAPPTEAPPAVASPAAAQRGHDGAGDAAEDPYLYDSCPAITASDPQLARADFDAYLFLNPDVADVVGDHPAAAIDHWLLHGRPESRLLPGLACYVSRGTLPSRVLERPFGVNFYGFIRAKSGLGTAARGYLRALRAAAVPFRAHNVEWFEDRLRITRTRGSQPGPYRINLIHINADTIGRFCQLFAAGHFDNAYNIGIWAWELAAFRPDWHAQFAALDEVWGISEFATRAIGAISPVPVVTVHHVVEPDSKRVYDRAYFGLPAEKFLFYCVFDVGSHVDRKNPEAIIQAFALSFRDEPGAALVLKFHSPHLDPERVQSFMRLCQGLSNVIVISDLLGERETSSLRLLVDCVVSPHRAEGFGLNLAEAMYLGIPAIATRYASNLDFMDDDNSYLVDYRLTEIAKAVGPYLEHYVWAEPSVEHLSRLMAEVYRDRAAARRRARLAAERIRADFSARAIGDRIKRRFAELGLAEPGVDEPRPETGGRGFAAHYGQAKAVAAHHPIMSSSEAVRERVRQLRHRPVISVIVPVYDVAAVYLERCIESVKAQSYPFWELCLADDGSRNPETRAVLARYQGTDPRIRIRYLPHNRGIAAASNEAVEMSTGQYLAMLDNDDELAPEALFEVASAVTADPTIDCLYTDEDKLDPDGRRCDHYCKPDWSPEHLESVMYVLHMLVVRKSLFLEIGGFRNDYSGAQDYDLMLRISRETERIHHIPKIAYHWRMIPGSSSAQVGAKPAALDAATRALTDHVAIKYHGRAWVEPGLLPSHFRVRHQIVGNPAVTLLILTNNSSTYLPDRGEFIMVDNLICSILEKTAYANYRIIVVDNGNSTMAQIRMRRQNGIDTISYPGPVEPFNYSHKCNFSMRQVRTEQVVILNDDMAVMNRDWLGALLEFSQLPQIGVVGAKLFHADGTLQHCGMVLGVNEGSAHIYHSFPGDFIGYNGFTHIIRAYSAVTGACLATKKSVWAQVKGLDEKFAIDYNDTDFCLRVREIGYRVLFTPHAQLYHFENKTNSRRAQISGEAELFRQRWAKYIADDPFYNPNLARDAIDFRLRQPEVDSEPGLKLSA